jgi:hypothetical protein
VTLEQWVAASRQRLFADLALGAAMQQHSIRLCNIEGLPWCEVDSADDLLKSERTFSETAGAFQL